MHSGNLVYGRWLVLAIVALLLSLAPVSFLSEARLSGSGDLLYGTFLGGSSWERAYGIAVDALGNVYITGYTQSGDFPTTPEAYSSPTRGGQDVFVAKFDPTGASPLYIALLGGSNDETAYDIAVDAAGNAYVVGRTDSTDFPTTANAFDCTYNGAGDAFLVRLNAAGATLAYATYLGASGEEEAHGVAVDGAGNAYITGWTYSSQFPHNDDSFGNQFHDSRDAFLLKLRPTGAGSADLVYGGFIGGLLHDEGYDIAVDMAGSAYVVGWTQSEDLAGTSGAFDQIYNGYGDAFVAKVNADGRSLGYLTLLGGSRAEVKMDNVFRIPAFSIAVDRGGSAYVVGGSESSDFPCTPGAFQTARAGSADVFLTRLSADGSSLLYSTYLGGSLEDVATGIALDADGNACLTGATLSRNFPTAGDPYDSSHNGSLTRPEHDAFIARLSPAGRGPADLFYSTFLGSRPIDTGNAISLDANGHAHVTGYTQGAAFPHTASAYQATLNGEGDAFWIKLRLGQPVPTATPTCTATHTRTLTPTSSPTRTPTGTLTATPPPPPDLVVAWMKIELETGSSCDYTSTALGVRAFIANQGWGTAGPFVLEVNGAQQMIKEGLAPRATADRWFPGFIWPGENAAFVDATDLVVESDETNNVLTQFLSIPTLPPTCTPSPTATYTPTPAPETATPSRAQASLPLVLKGR